MPIQNSQTAIKYKKNVQFHMLIAFCYISCCGLHVELPKKHAMYPTCQVHGKASTMFINLTIEGLDTSKYLESFLR